MAEFGTGTVFLNRSPSIDEVFRVRRRRARDECWAMISEHFSVPIASTVRDTGNDSLHERSRGGLAADFGAGFGQTPTSPAFIEEREICDWAKKFPNIFQEVMHHDTGSGFHAHLAMNGNLKFMKTKVRNALKGQPRK
jgi:hypothetical protein